MAGDTRDYERGTIHDLRGAVGEGFGETSPVEWGRPHEVGRGESLFPVTQSDPDLVHKMALPLPREMQVRSVFCNRSCLMRSFFLALAKYRFLDSVSRLGNLLCNIFE